MALGRCDGIGPGQESRSRANDRDTNDATPCGIGSLQAAAGVASQHPGAAGLLHRPAASQPGHRQRSYRSHPRGTAMLALAAAAHGGIAQSPTLFIIAAIAVAAFWKALVKIGLAALVIGVLVLIFMEASAFMHVVHAITP